MDGKKNEASCSSSSTSDSGQAVSLNEKNLNSQLPLEQYLIDELLDCLPIRANQARRFIKLIAEKPYSKTSICNLEALSVNLGDLAKKYNPYIENKGYQIDCEMPEILIRNSLGEQTMQHLWWLRKTHSEVGV